MGGGKREVFKNWYIESEVRRIINKPIEEITMDDLRSIKGLKIEIHDAPWEKERIEEVSKLTQLEELVLRGMELEDISSLTKLKKLRRLDLGDNKIQDFSCLTELINLEYLNLEYNNIQKLPCLERLSNLRELNLYCNPIQVVDNLNNLRKIKSINLSRTKVQWISLDFAHQITEIGIPVGLLNYDFIQTFTGIKSLIIEDVDEKSIGLEAILKHKSLCDLQKLTIKGIHMRGVKAILHLKQLIHLDLRGNGLRDISGLEDLTYLKYLDLSSNWIDDISCLKTLVELETLLVYHTFINNISVVKHLKKLKNLDCVGCKVADINSVVGLNELETLKIARTCVKDIAPLKKLPQLKQVYKEEIWDNNKPLSTLKGINKDLNSDCLNKFIDWVQQIGGKVKIRDNHSRVVTEALNERYPVIPKQYG